MTKQSDVRRLDCHIAPHCAHRDAHLCAGECGSVIDSVAYHRNRALSRELRQGRHLALRQKLGSNLVDACAVSQELRRQPVVSGQHRNREQVQRWFLEPFDDLARLRAQFIPHADRTQQHSGHLNENYGRPLPLKAKDVVR
jgi:hypothetical protein